MYKDIFDHKSQKELDNCFLEALSGCGMTCEIKKGEIINPDSSNYIFLVLEGEVNQLMYSKDGNEIIFFRILAIFLPAAFKLFPASFFDAFLGTLFLFLFNPLNPLL